MAGDRKMLMVRKCSSASVSKASVKGCRIEGKIYILRNIDRGDCELLSSAPLHKACEAITTTIECCY